MLHLSNRVRPLPGIATTRGTPLRHLSGPVSQIKTPNSLHNRASHRIYRTPWRQERRCLSSRLLHPEKPDASVVPHACRALGNLHLSCEDVSPQERLIPAHGKRRPLKRVILDWRRLDGTDGALANGLQRSGSVGATGSSVGDSGRHFSDQHQNGMQW